MQKGPLINLIFVIGIIAAFVLPTEVKGNLVKADSLYTAKQYTQAFDHYLTLQQAGQYSPAMLLKMAYIQEGLSHLGESLYYLNLYYLASDDPQALKKMEELAVKNRLEGYEASQSTLLFNYLQENYLLLAAFLASLNILLLAYMFYLRRLKKSTPAFLAILGAFIASGLFTHINYSKEARRGIVAQPLTYLMSGPSSAAAVVAIIGEGHQLHITGQEDVWLKVEWKNKEVFIREFLLRPVRL